MTKNENKAEAKFKETDLKQWKQEKISIEYLEKEVQSIDLNGFQVVRRENFAKLQCPALTVKYGEIYFNLKTIRKFDEVKYIQILVHKEEKKLIIRPTDDNSREALQWCRIDKHGKLQKRSIGARMFAAKLYKDMGWNSTCTIKCLGTFIKCRDEKIFLFELDNNEMYISLAATDSSNENKKIRIAFEPKHWEDNYGRPVEEYDSELIKTFENVPDGYVVLRQTPIQPKSKQMSI